MTFEMLSEADRAAVRAAMPVVSGYEVHDKHGEIAGELTDRETAFSIAAEYEGAWVEVVGRYPGAARSVRMEISR